MTLSLIVSPLVVLGLVQLDFSSHGFVGALIGPKIPSLRLNMAFSANAVATPFLATVRYRYCTSKDRRKGRWVRMEKEENESMEKEEDRNKMFFSSDL